MKEMTRRENDIARILISSYDLDFWGDTPILSGTMHKSIMKLKEIQPIKYKDFIFNYDEVFKVARRKFVGDVKTIFGSVEFLQGSNLGMDVYLLRNGKCVHRLRTEHLFVEEDKIERMDTLLILLNRFLELSCARLTKALHEMFEYEKAIDIKGWKCD